MKKQKNKEYDENMFDLKGSIFAIGVRAENLQRMNNSLDSCINFISMRKKGIAKQIRDLMRFQKVVLKRVLRIENKMKKDEKIEKKIKKLYDEGKSIGRISKTLNISGDYIRPILNIDYERNKVKGFRK